FSWVFFLASKDETASVLKTFIIGLENLLSLKVKIIRCDNGTEFKNADLHQFCGLKGIKREFSVPRTPQQNGITERKNRTLIKAAKTLLADSLLPIPFWVKAVNTACYVQNRMLVTKPHNKTPYELLHGAGPAWLFDIDSLTQTMNYHQVLAENQSNSNAGFQDTKKAGEEGTQTYVLFHVLSDGFTNLKNNNKDDLVDGKEHDDIQKSVSPDIHSSSCGDQTWKQGDKTENKDKGKSHVVTITGFRDLNKEFEECINNNSNGVNAASSLIGTTSGISASGKALNKKNTTQDQQEGPTNFALMAYTSQGSSSSETKYEAFKKSHLEIIAYQLGLESLETRIVVHEKNEAVYEEDIKILKIDVMLRDNALAELKNQMKNALKEKDDLKLKLENDLNDVHMNESQVIGNSLIDSHESDGEDNQVNDRFKKSKEYHAVPAPYTGNYMPPRADLSFAGLDDSVFKFAISETVTSVNETETSTSKTSKESLEKTKMLGLVLLSLKNENQIVKMRIQVNTARPKAVINAVRMNWVNDVKASACWVWRPIKPNSASITLKRYDYVDDPENSLIMRNEEINTIPEKELDEFIKSSVEDLVPIPSEFEDTFGSESVCILPSCDDFSPNDIPEEKAVTFSNPLFNSNVNFISSDDDDVNPLFDEVLENIERKDSYDSNLDEPNLLVTHIFDVNKDECFDSGGDDDEINVLDCEDDYYDSEGDILYLKSLLNDDLVHHDPSIPAMSVASILEGFTDEPPLEENDELLNLEPKNDDLKKILYDAPILMTEEKKFDPRIHDQNFSPTYDCTGFEDSHARGFVHHPLELQSFAYGNPIS
nr:putative ribonuclease H-like domain-containing protein [Tanacetum cinerariifolium]